MNGLASLQGARLRMIRFGCGLSLAFAAVVLAAPEAQAYPQWQFTSGTTRCNQCHFSPAGGGLLRGYGRDAAGEDLSTFEGNGGLLHGLVEPPDWLALGGDFRLAYVRQDVAAPDSPEQALFPMQADLHGRVAIGESLSIQASAGYRGQVRNADTSGRGYQPGNAHRFISREHFVMWQPAAQGLYARAGRFYAPYGLRLAEHVTYVRRDLAFNILQESYNVSGGYIANEWELHLTAFGPDFLQKLGAQETGGAAYYERRLFEETASIAVQGRFGTFDGVSRLMGGVVARYFIEPAKLMFLAEANLVNNHYPGSAAQNQFVGLTGFTYLPWNSVIFTALLERSQTALQVRDSATDSVMGLINWFPYPHTEFQLVGRVQKPMEIETAKTLLLQFHYWL